MCCSTSDTPDPLVCVFPMPLRLHSSNDALLTARRPRLARVDNGAFDPGMQHVACTIGIRGDVTSGEARRGLISRAWSGAERPAQTTRSSKSIASAWRTQQRSRRFIRATSARHAAQARQRSALYGLGRRDRASLLRSRRAFSAGKLSCRVPRRRRHHSCNHRGAAGGSPLALYLQSPRTARLARWRARG